MYFSAVSVNPVSIIFTTILVMLWIFSVFTEIICVIFDIEKERFIEAIHKDLDIFIKPITAVGKAVSSAKEGVVGAVSKIKGAFSKKEDTLSEKQIR